MNISDVYDQRKSFFIEAPSFLRLGALICVGVGIASMAAGFATGMGTRVWGAFLFNLFFFFCLGLGGMAFAAMQDVIGANWGRPIRRIQEAFGAFVPVGIALLTVYLVLVLARVGPAGDVYSWIRDPSVLNHFHGKDKYLVPFWFGVRVAVVLLAMLWVSLFQFKMSIKRDQLFLEGNNDEAAFKLAKEAQSKLKFWSAPILVVYGVGFTFLGMDLIMSLSPLWFSTLWGGWQFAVMMQTLMASLLITMFILKDSNPGKYIQRQQFHDVGKLMHGFTIFFAYLTYAHVLTYWYGNMPEETEYFLERLHEPWIYLVLTIPIFGFVIPLYTLIFKAAKWTKAVAMPLSIIILGAQWLTYMLITMPVLVKAEDFTSPGLEIGVFIGMLGLFVTCFCWFAKRFPMLPLTDPLLKDAIEGHH
ncbi:MAG: hypothetical protein HRU19_04270 [Pseudobacteriovorax sp.]|nr:hypothetical protein [Pseudobacteriovorax sp.]